MTAENTEIIIKDDLKSHYIFYDELKDKFDIDHEYIPTAQEMKYLTIVKGGKRIYYDKYILQNALEKYGGYKKCIPINRDESHIHPWYKSCKCKRWKAICSVCNKYDKYMYHDEYVTLCNRDKCSRQFGYFNIDVESPFEQGACNSAD